MDGVLSPSCSPDSLYFVTSGRDVLQNSVKVNVLFFFYPFLLRFFQIVFPFIPFTKLWLPAIGSVRRIGSKSILNSKGKEISNISEFDMYTFSKLRIFFCYSFPLVRILLTFDIKPFMINLLTFLLHSLFINSFLCIQLFIFSNIISSYPRITFFPSRVSCVMFSLYLCFILFFFHSFFSLVLFDLHLPFSSIVWVMW